MIAAQIAQRAGFFGLAGAKVAVAVVAVFDRIAPALEVGSQVGGRAITEFAIFPEPC
jgi:hypothetical protein